MLGNNDINFRSARQGRSCVAGSAHLPAVARRFCNELLLGGQQELRGGGLGQTQLLAVR